MAYSPRLWLMAIGWVTRMAYSPSLWLIYIDRWQLAGETKGVTRMAYSPSLWLMAIGW
jgi:hypothetical protein